MKNVDIGKIRKKMEKALDPKRYEHTLGVAYTASCLAMCHGADPVKAKVAGLLHDSAKCMTDKKRIAICKRNHLPISQVEWENPFLLHAKVGSYLAKSEYHITDQDILNAILYHTTGRPGMSRLEKIVYVADYIEPSRKQAPHLCDIRKLAFRDLDEALFRILKDTLEYLQGIGNTVDQMTQETYDFYQVNRKGSKEGDTCD